MAFRAPLLGYNTNVRHKGKLYHIQTEDSGVDHPHVITHLFADGGRIVATRKTSYAERVGSEGLAEVVKKLMQAQHKAMFIALRDGAHEEEDDIAEELQSALLPEDPTPGPGAVLAEGPAPQALPPVRPPPTPAAPARAPTQTALPRVVSPTATALPPVPAGVPVERAGLYRATQAATSHMSPRPPASAREAPRALFGGQHRSDRSLDELILSYLAANDNET